MKTARPFICSIVVLALITTACATTAAGPGTDAGSPSDTEPRSPADGSGPGACPEEGCPVPDCGDGPVVRQPGDDTRAMDDLYADAEEWLTPIVGDADDMAGLPTPQGSAAVLLRRDGRDLAVAWYVEDGDGGLFRDHFVACAWAVES